MCVTSQPKSRSPRLLERTVRASRQKIEVIGAACTQHAVHTCLRARVRHHHSLDDIYPRTSDTLNQRAPAARMDSRYSSCVAIYIFIFIHRRAYMSFANDRSLLACFGRAGSRPADDWEQLASMNRLRWTNTGFACLLARRHIMPSLARAQRAIADACAH